MDDYPFLPQLMEWLWYAIVFLYGAIVGSFLNVVIYRLPLGKPIGGKSYCPNCHTYLKWYHNVPLFGFLFLRGRCAFCKAPISWRYFTVELLNACLWVALYHRVSTNVPISWVDFVFQALFGSVLIALVYIDLDHFIAPTELNITGFVLGLGRDIVCLGLAYTAGDYIFKEQAPKYAYFNFLPHAVPGAIVYGAALYLVSFTAFLYYARGPHESLASAVRRFFTFEELPETEETRAERQREEEALAEEANGEDESDPPRLRFSPGITSILAATLLSIIVGAWSILAFVIPLVAFAGITRKPGEGPGSIFRRFFSADDLGISNAYETVPAEADATDDAISEATLAEEEANQFAREAPTGKHGGMGLGDAQLAVAIGAMLGPGMALLSLFFATLFGAVVGILFTRLNGRSLRYGVPFVPFMAAGAIIVMLFGSAIVDWYLIYSGLRKPPPPIPDPPKRQRRIKARPTATPDPVAPYRGN